MSDCVAKNLLYIEAGARLPVLQKGPGRSSRFGVVPTYLISRRTHLAWLKLFADRMGDVAIKTLSREEEPDHT
jgi:hypothetical protein